ncbi:hypothetical protein BJY52DRAFT_1305759 [Lactarius psammicola]|nr:hypothetical protein BJY52DRAFT_1305759 [Lactarius psammicola]
MNQRRAQTPHEKQPRVNTWRLLCQLFCSVVLRVDMPNASSQSERREEERRYDTIRVCAAVCRRAYLQLDGPPPPSPCPGFGYGYSLAHLIYLFPFLLLSLSLSCCCAVHTPPGVRVRSFSCPGLYCFYVHCTTFDTIIHKPHWTFFFCSAGLP